MTYVVSQSGAIAAADSTTPCPDLLVAQHMVQGHLVGETDCQITSQSTVPDNQGRPFDRVDVALSGTAFGYADPVTTGNTRKDLTDVPNVLFPQFGITSWVPGVGSYSGGTTADKGAGLSVLYPDPAARTPWNGKVFILTHGQGNNTPLGNIVPRNIADGLDPDTFDNLYAGQMIDKGYAVIYTRRPAASGVPTTLANGTVLDESLNDNVDMILSFLQSGEKLIQSKLGKSPTKVYWYGHSAGVILGRLVNYSGLNADASGKPYIDGFLDDDPGGGLPLPVSMQEGNVLGEQGGTATFDKKDEMFQTASSRNKFTKELTLAHQLYQDYHSWLPQVSYLNLKREGALLYQQEGLSSKTRTYEIAGVSHIANTSSSPANTLDIGGIADSAIDLLDNWVQKNIDPPATVTDLSAVSHAKPGQISEYTPFTVGPTKASNQQTALFLPPVACPTGVRFGGQPPAGGTSQTGYAAYDGKSPEPVNSNGVLIDVNGNGTRDTMPTMQGEWQALGLLGKNKTLTKSVYVSCVQQSVNTLTKQKLLSQKTADWYVQQAQNFPNLSW